MKVNEARLKIINSLNRNVSQSDIAKALDLDRSSISIKIKNEKDLTLDEIAKLEKHFQVCLQNSTNENDSLLYIPKCADVSASLGSGKEVFSEKVTEQVTLPKSMFKKISADPKHCCIINTDGSSMYPTIIGGQDMIMIDTSQIEVFDGRIYLIRMDNSLFCKRLQKLPNNQLKVISDNPKYDSYTLDLNKEDLNFAVIGRVVWISRPL